MYSLLESNVTTVGNFFSTVDNWAGYWLSSAICHFLKFYSASNHVTLIKIARLVSDFQPNTETYFAQKQAKIQQKTIAYYNTCHGVIIFHYNIRFLLFVIILRRKSIDTFKFPNWDLFEVFRKFCLINFTWASMIVNYKDFQQRKHLLSIATFFI